MKKKSSVAVNHDDIKAIVGFMSPTNRINGLIDYLKIQKSEIARRHGCSVNNVCLVLSGASSSAPLQNTIYRMLLETLGDACPQFEHIFDTEIKEAVANG